MSVVKKFPLTDLKQITAMKIYRKLSRLAAVLAAVVALVSCGAKKAVVDGASGSTTVAGGASSADGSGVAALEQMNYLRRVADNAVYAKNIVSKINCTINTGSKEMSVSGSLHMKKDAVIRIQITPFGLMEAARLEFTPDYVLLVDRLHKEYVKASYSDVSFLQQNSLDFYALQALFWNQLFVPGTQKMTDSSLKNFTASLDGKSTTDVSITGGKMNYVWTTESRTALISAVNAKYTGKGAGANTSVTCKYGSFKSVGAKQFPSDITLTMSNSAVKNAGKMMLRLQLNNITSEDGWEEKTSVSSKYTQVSVQDLLGKLGSL